MNVNEYRLFVPAARTRLVVAVAVVAVNAALLGGLAGLFHEASTMPFLAATPHNEALMAKCAGVHGSAAKRACAESVVAQALRPAVPASGEGAYAGAAEVAPALPGAARDVR